MTATTTTSLPETAPSAVRIKKLMVPLDLSQHAHKAIRYAVRFAQQFGAEIDLVHVISPLGYDGLIIPTALQEVNTQLRKHAREELQKLVGMEEQYRIKLKADVLLGDPAHEIAKLAQERGTDMIVLTTHGRSGFTHALLGSVTERIVRHAPCPVFVVHAREHDFISENKTESRTIPS